MMHAAVERPDMGKGCCKETAVRSTGVRGREGMQPSAEILQSQSHPLELVQPPVTVLNQFPGANKMSNTMENTMFNK